MYMAEIYIRSFCFHFAVKQLKSKYFEALYSGRKLLEFDRRLNTIHRLYLQHCTVIKTSPIFDHSLLLRRLVNRQMKVV